MQNVNDCEQINCLFVLVSHNILNTLQLLLQLIILCLELSLILLYFLHLSCQQVDIFLKTIINRLDID